jgi:dTDP-4-dehydrorhamnose reductase
VPAEAFATNVITTLHIARWTARHRRLLVYISSDQVYSGRGPHSEDRPRPVNEYGRTKYAGELAAMQSPLHLALRTNFYGSSRTRPSFTDWICSSLAAGREVQLDDGARFSPLHLTQLADVLRSCIELGIRGVFNLGCREGVYKLDFARDVAEMFQPGSSRLVTARPTVDPRRAPRPLDLALDVSRLEERLGTPLATIGDGLRILSAEMEEGAWPLR